ncbi:MAG: MFS transporter, partial [Providencia sp.]
MFAPSFFTGLLVHHLGAKRIIFCGVILLMLSAVMNLIGHSFYHSLFAGILVGVAWHLIVFSTTIV